MDLNIVQKEAVDHIEGPVLILAGAGTGKTFVLINRITNILHNNKAVAEQILATTFTNKAASEMRARIFNMSSYSLPWLGTFHSLSAKILRLDGHLIGIAPNFSILDASDQEKLIKSIMYDLNIDTKQFSPSIISNIIQRWKDLALLPENVTSLNTKNPINSFALKIYIQYQKRLAMMDSVDFGDLLLMNILLFKNQPIILEKYQSMFRYIMVDEYQDTNAAQYIWLRMLAQSKSNICCVGDDDQSIYGWRGAEVGNILKFPEHFPSAKIIKLEQNYRSTPHILKAASGVIANNSMRHGKTLWTDKKSENMVQVVSCWNDKEEGNFIANEIRSLMRRSIINLNNQIVILVRALFQTRIIEECFMNHLISYKVIGSLKFYERQEIKDILAYIKLIFKTNDDISFERIINKPARSIGKTSVDKIKTVANERSISLFKASEICMKEGLFSKGTENALKNFINMIHSWQKDFESNSMMSLVPRIIEDSGYKEMIKKDDSLEAADRMDNIKELSQALEDFPSITEFLEHIALISDNDDKTQDENKVNIMSMHAAKGLEFEVVFLPGWEEGVFPHPRTINELHSKGVEEERRLAYVAITRAKKYLYISYAASRRIYNQWQNSMPSRFLKELPKDSYVLKSPN